MSARDDIRESVDLALRYVAQDGSQHYPAGDNWRAADNFGTLDLLLLDAMLRAAAFKVTAEIHRRFGAD